MIALADERVGADGDGVAEAHLLLVGLVEGAAGDADEHDDDAEVDDVSAVAAGVAADEQDDGGGEEVLAGLGADDAGAAEELGRDGGDDAGAEGEGNQREDAWRACRRRRVQGRMPAIMRTTAVATMAMPGRMKLRRMARREVERQASSGPTPVRKSRKRPMGTLTRL